MLDAALIKECADPALKPAIVEQFVAAAGSTDPLAVAVKSGGRVILVPKPTSVDEAMAIIRQHTGRSVVRVGLTQFPAGLGVKDAADLKPELFDACDNLRRGTAMFAKILRIVTKWYGNPASKDALPQIFDDAVYAWKTGEFEGVRVFQTADPRDEVETGGANDERGDEKQSPVAEGAERTADPLQEKADIGAADMRIDLSRIGGK